MVRFGRMEGLPRLDAGDNRGQKHAGLGKLLDIRSGATLLHRILREYRRTVLRADIIALPVQLGGIMRDREKHL